MRTTIELPDGLFRELRIHAAKRGLSMKSIFTEALQRYLREPESNEKLYDPNFGALKDIAAEVDKVQERIDSEFSTVDESQWR